MENDENVNGPINMKNDNGNPNKKSSKNKKIIFLVLTILIATGIVIFVTFNLGKKFADSEDGEKEIPINHEGWYEINKGDAKTINIYEGEYNCTSSECEVLTDESSNHNYIIIKDEETFIYDFSNKKALNLNIDENINNIYPLIDEEKNKLYYFVVDTDANTIFIDSDNGEILYKESLDLSGYDLSYYSVINKNGNIYFEFETGAAGGYNNYSAKIITQNLVPIFGGIEVNKPSYTDDGNLLVTDEEIVRLYSPDGEVLSESEIYKSLTITSGEYYAAIDSGNNLVIKNPENELVKNYIKRRDFSYRFCSYWRIWCWTRWMFYISSRRCGYRFE